MSIDTNNFVRLNKTIDKSNQLKFVQKQIRFIRVIRVICIFYRKN